MRRDSLMKDSSIGDNCSRACARVMRGLHDACEACGSADIEQETRVVGYFSKVRNWNKSKRKGELPARQRGHYSVEHPDVAATGGAADAGSIPANPPAAG